MADDAQSLTLAYSDALDPIQKCSTLKHCFSQNFEEKLQNVNIYLLKFKTLAPTILQMLKIGSLPSQIFRLNLLKNNVETV